MFRDNNFSKLICGSQNIVKIIDQLGIQCVQVAQVLFWLWVSRSPTNCVRGSNYNAWDLAMVHEPWLLGTQPEMEIVLMNFASCNPIISLSKRLNTSTCICHKCEKKRHL